MATYPRQVRLQEHGCKALQNLGASDEPSIKKVFNSDGIRLLLTAMKAHTNQAELQYDAFVALHYALLSDETRKIVVESGGIELIKAAQQAHPGNDSLQELAAVLPSLFTEPRDT